MEGQRRAGAVADTAAAAAAEEALTCSPPGPPTLAAQVREKGRGGPGSSPLGRCAAPGSQATRTRRARV